MAWIAVQSVRATAEPPASSSGPEAPRAAAGQTAVTVLMDDLAEAGDLAAPATGQTVYVVDERRSCVVAVDPFDATKRWIAVTPAGAAAQNGIAQRRPVPMAIGCIDSSTLVLLCRAEGEWSLRTHRLGPPGSAASADEPAQAVVLGPKTDPVAEQAAGKTAAPMIAVSHSRDWLAVTGLPQPLPTVLQGPIVGTRLGGFSTRKSPALAAGVRPSAATVSPFDELVLFASGADGSALETAFLSLYSPLGPRRLLHVDTGLTNVRDACYCRADGSLWVVAGEPGSFDRPEGLWRIDAVMRDSRQAARAVCFARLPDPRSLVCLSERAIVVSHGTGPRAGDAAPAKAARGRVVLVDPHGGEPTQSGRTASEER